ncbi:hypothetical protein [Curtobacterium sp. NPDC092190]|uniref:hypothetical protein n=1 Tax=Curtobacterium sp. NPDC092190 TaxID=3363973 RepID=UPI0037F2D881
MTSDTSQIAFVGTLIGAGVSLAGSVITPWALRRSERRRSEADSRTAALRRLLPAVMEAGARTAGEGLEWDEMGRRLATATELQLWLRPDEWQITSIAMTSLLATDPERHVSVQANASLVLAAWARGEISPERALRVFESRTGAEITKPTFDDVA